MARNTKYALKRNTQTILTNIIKTRIADINLPRYPKGPALHFYHRVLALRRQFPSVSSFLASNDCIEILYAALLAWDMNSRAAKMKDYADLKSNLQGASAAFQAVEAASQSFTWTSRTTVVQTVSSLFDSLCLMKTEGRVVSNSKCMHFVFPDLCIPADSHSFEKLYGKNAGGTKDRFMEVLEFSYDILNGIQNPQQYLDNVWNASLTKLVDNAIILM